MSELIIKSIYFNIISKSAIHKVQKIEVFIIIITTIINYSVKGQKKIQHGNIHHKVKRDRLAVNTKMTQNILS